MNLSFMKSSLGYLTTFRAPVHWAVNRLVEAMVFYDRLEALMTRIVQSCSKRFLNWLKEGEEVGRKSNYTFRLFCQYGSAF